jgi:Protein of unknown function DUF86
VSLGGFLYLRGCLGPVSARLVTKGYPGVGNTWGCAHAGARSALLGDIATKPRDEVIKATPEFAWREVKGMRIIAAHAYHRIDYEEVWVNLAR